MVAPRRPRIGAVFFLVMAAFLLTNKVYSPQYMLWLLPFVVLARPVWRDWLIFTAGELIYFVAIWWHLGGLLAPGGGGADRIYWLAVIIRMAHAELDRDHGRPRCAPTRARCGPARRLRRSHRWRTRRCARRLVVARAESFDGSRTRDGR